MNTHIYIGGRRKQVSIEADLISQLADKGYTLDSFLQHELVDLKLSDFSSKKIQYLTRRKLEEMTINHESLPKETDHCFTFVDLFAGIGGFRLPLERQNGKCLGYSEIQWDSMRVYTNNFVMNEKYFGDIRKLSTLDVKEHIDLIVGGVPCQSWSSAGKNRGFDDERGRLWLDTLRIVEKNKPQCFLFENVKGLADPRHTKALNYITNMFKDIGYKLTYQVLSSRDFGLVQDRERIFLVGFRDATAFEKFEWPTKNLTYPSLGEIIKIPTKPAESQIQKAEDQLSLFPQSKEINFASHNDQFNDYFIFSDVRTGDTTIHSWDFIKLTAKEKMLCEKFPSIRRRLGKKLYGRDGAALSLKDIINDTGSNLSKISKKELESLVKKGIFKRFTSESEDTRYDFNNSKQSTGINGIYRIYSPNAISFPTITATGSPDFISLLPFKGETQAEYNTYFIKEIYKKSRYRNLSDREIARLQGFPDEFKLGLQGNAKRQFGNAVSVPVVEEIIKSIKKTGVFSKKLE